MAEIRWLGSYCRSCCRERREERLDPGCGQGPIAPKQLPSNPEATQSHYLPAGEPVPDTPESGDKDFVLVQPC